MISSLVKKSDADKSDRVRAKVQLPFVCAGDGVYKQIIPQAVARCHRFLSIACKTLP